VRWRNHFSQLLNVHGVKDVRQIDILTTEPLVPEPSVFHFEIATEKLMGNKSPCTDQIPVEKIKVGNRTIHFEIHKLINSIWNEENCLRSGRFRSLCPFIRRAIKQTVVIIEEYHFYQLHTKVYATSCCQS